MRNFIYLGIAFVCGGLSTQLRAQSIGRYVNPSGVCGVAPCYTRIQDAVNASAGGDTIFIQAGSYQENVVVDSSLIFIGAGQASTILMPAFANVGDVTNTGSAFGTASDIMELRASGIGISDLTIEGSNPALFGTGNEAVRNGVTIDARNGIIIRPDTNITKFTFKRLAIRDVFERGINLTSAYPPTTMLTDSVVACQFSNVEGIEGGSFGLCIIRQAATVEDCRFDHGYAISNWLGPIKFARDTVTNSWGGIECDNFGSPVTIDHCYVDSRIDYCTGILVFHAMAPASIQGNHVYNCWVGLGAEGADNVAIQLDSNIVDGQYGGFGGVTGPIYGGYFTTEVPGYAPAGSLGVNLTSTSGPNSFKNVQTGIRFQASNASRDYLDGPINSSYAGNFTLTPAMSGVVFNNIAGNFVELNIVGSSSQVANVDASSSVFGNYSPQSNSADAVYVEDHILHRLDNPALGPSAGNGLVVSVPNTLYVTGNQGNTQIQRAVDALTADGWKIVAAPGSYAEDVSVTNNSISLDNYGPDSLQGLEANAPGKIVVLDKPLVLTSSLGLSNGIIQAAGVADTLDLLAGVAVTGGNDGSYVDGVVAKAGNAAFTFPLGHNGKIRPVAISAPANATDVFFAQYEGQDPRTAVSPAAIFSPGTPPMLLVSGKEYWNVGQLNGTSPVAVSLNWKDATTSGTLNSSSDLVVAGNDLINGWYNLGANNKVTAADGSIWVSSNMLSPDISPYQAFALGSISLASPLPIELETFTGNKVGNAVELLWRTAEESNSSIFEVQRSVDGRGFVPIDTVPAAGYSASPRDYSVYDEHPPEGMDQYRLRMIDKDGHFTYSTVVSVVIEQVGGTLTVGVEPNSKLIIARTAIIDASAERRLLIFDVLGRQLYEVPMPDRSVTIPASSLARGTYFAVLWQGSRRLAVQEFIY